MKTFKDFERAVRRTSGMDGKPLEHALAVYALGVAGEAGECADLAKKWLGHGVALDNEQRAKMEKELGDVLWYVTALADVCGFTLESVAQANVEKLNKRFPEGFTHAAALARVDVQAQANSVFAGRKP